jgi:hypothetical protein
MAFRRSAIRCSLISISGYCLVHTSCNSRLYPVFVVSNLVIMYYWRIINVLISSLHCMRWRGIPGLVVPSIAWQTSSTGWVTWCCVDPRLGLVVAVRGMVPLAPPTTTENSRSFLRCLSSSQTSSASDMLHTRSSSRSSVNFVPHCHGCGAFYTFCQVSG